MAQTGKDSLKKVKGRPSSGSDAVSMLKSIRRIVRAIDIHSKAVTKAVGLTIPQIVVLQAIRDLGEVTTSTLSAHADLSAATVVTILDKLEDKGLVERYRSTTDRRIVHSRLTRNGTRTLTSAPSLLQDDFVAAFEALPPAEQDRLRVAFEEVAAMMDAQHIDAGPVFAVGKLQ